MSKHVQTDNVLESFQYRSVSHGELMVTAVIWSDVCKYNSQTVLLLKTCQLVKEELKLSQRILKDTIHIMVLKIAGLCVKANNLNDSV